MKKTCLIILFNLITGYNAFCQVEELKQLDLNANEGGVIINLGKMGLAIRTRNGFDFYDENLIKTGYADFPTSGLLEYSRSISFDTVLKKIIVYGGGTNQIVFISPKTGEVKKIKTKFNKKAIEGWYIRSINIIENTIFVNYASSKTKWRCGILNMEDGIVNELSLPDKWDLTYYKTSKLNSKYLTIDYYDKESKLRNVALIDEEGKIVVEKLLEAEKSSMKRDNLSISDIGNGQLLISGNYYENRDSEIPIGIFLAKVMDFKQSFIKYFDFINIKDIDKFRLKTSSFFIKEFPYSVMVSCPSKLNNSYILNAEFSVPSTYNYDNYYYSDYIYTHTVFIITDEKGEELKNLCVPIFKSDKCVKPDKILNIKQNDEEINYSYIGDNKIQRVIVTDRDIEVLSPENFIKNTYESESTKNESTISDLWFGNYYYGMIKQRSKIMKKSIVTFKLIKYELKVD